MIISREKRKENIVEYIIYMWQIEDLIRAYNFDLVAIEKEIISQFDIDDQTMEEMVDWYDNLIQLMLKEKVEEKGHIQAIKNIVDELSKLHFNLLESPEQESFKKEFEELLPYLSDLLNKVKDKDKSLVEILLETLYGILMLKLKKEKLSEQTQEASLKISSFMSLMAKKYKQYEEDNEFYI